MLVRNCDEQTIEIVGTAFLCHSMGYMLTAAHNFNLSDNIGFVPPLPVGEFNPAKLPDIINIIPLTVAQYDAANDLALLKISNPQTVTVISDLLGDR